MNIIVCVKRVPDTSESNVKIDNSKKAIVKEGLVYTINEADNYALEEALLIKEKSGGTVTLITLGSGESEDTLRMGLAKGADSAIRLDDPAFDGSDGEVIAGILSTAIQGIEYDLVLTGCMAGDTGYAQVGIALAEKLQIPHAAMVTQVELNDKKAKVSRELEGGLLEVLELSLPAVLTIQTGINEPRYASIMGIAKASKKEIDIKGCDALGINADTVGVKGSKTNVQKMTLSVQDKMAELFSGTPEETSDKLSTLLKERGLL